jgi:hypothetical protein
VSAVAARTPAQTSAKEKGEYDRAQSIPQVT